MKPAPAPVQTSASPYRCAKCGAEIVHLALPEGTRDPWPYKPKQPVCAKCDGPLECVSVVEGLYRKRVA
jgi:hypothetical protein